MIAITETRRCVVCEVSIEHRRRDAKVCKSDACRKAKSRGTASTDFDPPAVTPPKCDHPITALDEDDDRFCVMCGALRCDPHWVMGYRGEELHNLLRVMKTDGDGLPHRLRRRKELQEWRTFAGTSPVVTKQVA